MILLSPYLLQKGRKDGYWVEDVMCHWCPACSCLHGFATVQPFHNGAIWVWDGDLFKPTFSPSMNISTEAYQDEEDPAFTIPPSRCHYRLLAGVIHYLGDCTHRLKGTEVPLPMLPENMRVV